MNNPSTETSPFSLPVKRDLRIVYRLSFIAAALMTLLSIAGLLRPSRLYPTEALLQSCMPNDVINLVIGLPILLGSMWLARRGKLIGLFFSKAAKSARQEVQRE